MLLPNMVLFVHCTDNDMDTEVVIFSNDVVNRLNYSLILHFDFEQQYFDFQHCDRYQCRQNIAGYDLEEINNIKFPDQYTPSK